MLKQVMQRNTELTHRLSLQLELLYLCTHCETSEKMLKEPSKTQPQFFYCCAFGSNQGQANFHAEHDVLATSRLVKLELSF
jgi:hypothetical protein